MRDIVANLMQDGVGVLLDASTEEKASKLVAAATQSIRYVAVARGLWCGDYFHDIFWSRIGNLN
jgi:hypothetical protein